MLFLPELKLPNDTALATGHVLDSPNRAAFAGWTALFVLFAVAAPLFVCMAPEVDVTLYDIAARNVLRGQVLYRDLFDNNFPGIVWLHMAIRSVFGWSSEAIRLVDLSFVAGNVALLVCWMRSWQSSAAARAWTAFTLFAFYLGTSEWCHCQRDVWMLVLAQLAALVRLRKLERLLAGNSTAMSAFYHSILEGLFWSAAVWIKPHVIIPAAALWAVSQLMWYRHAGWSGRLWMADSFGLLAAVLAVGAIGIAWLHMTGAWSSFLDVMFNWNPEYVSHGRNAGLRFLRIELFVDRMWPWLLVHAVAMPLAVVCLFEACSRSAEHDGDRKFHPRGLVLLSTFYVAWMAQAVLLQNLLDYIHVPPLLLGIVVIVGLWPRKLVPSATKIAFTTFVLVAALKHPMLEPQRLRLWPRCLQEGSTAEIRDLLALTRRTSWEDLAKVGDYLSDLELRDGELTCYNNPTNPLYLALNLQPSTRFVYPDNVMRCNPGHRDEVRRDLAASKQRVVVSDLYLLGSNANLYSSESRKSPDAEAILRQFPWSQPILFRSGRYLVHRVTGPFDRCWPEPAVRSDPIRNAANSAETTLIHRITMP